MKVNVALVRRQESGVAHFDFEEDFSSFESELGEVSFAAPVHVHLQVTNAGKSLLVHGQIQAQFRVVCGRCLDDFVYPLNISFEDEWIFAGEATEEQSETALIFEKDEIEISERIFEQMVLALPMRYICSPDCKGLCPVCGVNRNHTVCNCVDQPVDPRLAALAQWTPRD